jgi:hypothetical protein
MERAPHPVEEEHHPEPIPRDPELPTVSDTTLMFFAAAALLMTLVALLVLV